MAHWVPTSCFLSAFLTVYSADRLLSSFQVLRCQLTLPRQAAAVVTFVCCCWVGCVLVSSRLYRGGEERLPELFLQLLYSQPSLLFRLLFFSLKLSFFLQKSHSAGRRSLQAFWGLSSLCVPPRELLAIVSCIHRSAHFHLHPKQGAEYRSAAPLLISSALW